LNNQVPAVLANFRPSIIRRMILVGTAPRGGEDTAGAAFIKRLALRTQDLEPVAGPNVAKAQVTAFREWEGVVGERFAYLKSIHQPALVRSLFQFHESFTRQATAFLASDSESAPY
jgi:hypothetical protein